MAKNKKKPSPPKLTWNERWSKYWQTAGTPDYELPPGMAESVNDERDFLLGARTIENEMERLNRINKEFENGFRKLFQIGPAVTIFGSARYKENHPYYKLTQKLGGALANAGFTVLTGGGPGLMEAANRGAYDVGAKSVGLNISLPQEQFPNPYITPELCFQFRYFGLRKMHFMFRAKAMVAFPGGYGTLDEIFETLCLIQTRKIKPVPVILVGEEYWRRAFDVAFLAAEGTIDPEDAELFNFAETAEQIWTIITDWYAQSREGLFG